MRFLVGLQVQLGYGVLRKDADTLRATIGSYAGSGGDSEAARLRMLAALSDLQLLLLAHQIVYQHVRPRPQTTGLHADYHALPSPSDLHAYAAAEGPRATCFHHDQRADWHYCMEVSSVHDSR